MPIKFCIFMRLLMYSFTSSRNIFAFSHFSSNNFMDLEDSRHSEPFWIHSGKFQGDIDGVDEASVRHNPNVMYNALRNRQLTWTNAIIPFELDEAFTPSEAKLLHKAFKTYRRRTCIRFRVRRSEPDFLNIIKGHGCYSQVGKTGGKQEISLGRGCLFNETIIHELMHSIGFWHEHSRSDRDEHIVIRWENIAPGMDSQFDIVSPAIQDTLGENYDYRSIMHYGSSAFSKNGRNTVEAVADEFTPIIGTATDLSEMDVTKINKLYRCAKREPKKFSAAAKKNRRKTNNSPSQPPFGKLDSALNSANSAIFRPMRRKAHGLDHHNLHTTTLAPDPELIESTGECQDHFVDCPNFKDYCQKMSFFFIMKSYCPLTCGQCNVEE